MRCITIILFLFLSARGVAQVSDFILVKRNNKTLFSFYAGSQIEFITTGGVYKNAQITAIQHDSIYLREYLVRQLPTTLGYNILDTAGSFRYVYHYNQIGSIGPKPQRGFNVSGSGAALMGGGILLVLAESVVYLADREKFSPALMGASAGLATVGYFLSKAGSKGTVIGKRHCRIEYMKVTAGN